MTCIVGLCTGKDVWIGGDSAGTAGYDQTIRADEKVFTNGPMVLGFTSSFRMGQLLRYKLTVPKHLEGDDMAFLVVSFIDAVRTTLKEGGFATTKDGGEHGGCFIIGYKGRVYQIDSDYQVGSPVDGYCAVGCGADYALGSLHTSKGAPETRIRAALDAAAYFSTGVAGPYTILSGGAA